MSSYMVWAAEISTGVSVMTVLVMASLTVLFLTKCLRQDLMPQSGTALTRVDYNPPMNLMHELSIPLSLSLLSHNQNRLKFKLDIFAPFEEFEVGLYWRIPINTFHHVLRAPKNWVLRTFKDTSTRTNLFGEDGFKGFRDSFEPQESVGEDKVLRVPSEEVQTWAQEPLPRNHYPLVIVLCVSELVLFHVVHIQDEALRFPSRILNHYIKFDDGRSAELRPLFTQDSGECVVCQEKPVSRAFLPCRHACSCSDCFQRIKNKCPMCRTFIHSFFLVEDEAGESSSLSPDG
uniref:Cell growth regulator with RING finger domain protein 1 n=1 Tax=Caligus rogercresseyi TaxID=217165 RepID=C1BQT4_CALRO|nr:Cell growth regulator with RING finger domain protein 1 [Caligus rogercresseyi]